MLLARAVGGPAIAPARPTFGPSLSGAATVTLAPGVRVSGATIEDPAADRGYPITGIGVEVLHELTEGGTLDEVTTSVADRYGIDEPTVAKDIATFVEQLDRQGLISTHQSYLANMNAFLRAIAVAAPSLADLVMLDSSTLAQPTRRHPARAGYVVLACIEALMLLFAASLALTGAGVAFKSYEAWRQGASVPAVAIFTGIRPVLALSIFTALFVCHELGHLAAIRILGMTPRSVAVRMWAVGISYVADTPVRMFAVAAAGPTAGAAGALAVAGLIAVHPIPQLGIGTTEVTYVLLFGLLHLWALRPWAQDGRQAANALLSLRRRPHGPASKVRGTA